MPNQVTLTFAGDSQSLERSFSNVGQAANKMSGDLDSATGKAKSLDSSMGKVGETVDSSESKFMGTADVLDGLATTMGFNIDAQIGFARGMGDIAGGLTNLGPLLSGIAAKTGITTAATWAWNTAQTALNLVMSMNPIALTVIAIAALAAAFVVAWQHSETFRNVVTGAFEAVKGVIMGAFNWVKDNWPLLLGILTGPIGLAVVAISKNWDSITGFFGGAVSFFRNVFGGVTDAITAPFRSAFDSIKRLWNATVGGFGFTVPDWIPGVGGKGFTIPRMHMGGVIPGNPGQVVPILALAGERMGRAGASGGGGGVTIIVQGSLIHERQLADLIQSVLLKRQSRGGNLGFEAA